MIEIRPHVIIKSIVQHPVLIMFVANAGVAILGVVSLYFLLSILEVRDFAISGVLLGVGTFVAMGADMRLQDMASRRFFDRRRANASAALVVAQAAALVFLLQGVAVVFVSIVTIATAGHVFLAKPVPSWWALSAAFFSGTQLTISGLIGLVRCCGAFAWAAGLRLALQLINTVSLVIFLELTRHLDGYFLSLIVGGLLGLMAAILVCGHVVRYQFGGSLFHLAPFSEIAAIGAGVRSLYAGGLFSAGWMLTRAGDTLVVAACSGEVVTGTYRVARQIVDACQGLLDAIPHYFEPTIIAELKRGDWTGFRRHRRQIVACGLIVGAVGTLALVPLLQILTAHYWPKYSAAVMPIWVLMITMSVRLAVQPWLWAKSVAFTGMGKFSALLLAGGVVHLMLIGVFAMVHELTAVLAAAASWGGLAVLFLPYLYESRHRWLR